MASASSSRSAESSVSASRDSRSLLSHRPARRDPGSSASIRMAAAAGAARLRSASPASTTPASIPVENLVEHLLAAKRSLASVTSVLRANELVTTARAEHENAAIRTAQTAFLRRAMCDQAALLVRVRQSLQATYDSRRRRWDRLIKAMDAANQRLQDAMHALRTTRVQEGLRPPEEEPKTLVDFVDETAVNALLETMKRGLSDLQSVQQSFDEDLLRFDDDIHALRKALASETIQPPPQQQAEPESATLLLGSLTDHSRHVAELLTGLTRHFDLCVTAVRVTDGGMAVARLRAAEDDNGQSTSGGGGGGGGGDVSISGVIAEQESHPSHGNLEPMSMEERDDMMRVVVSDAAEVEYVVSEINERLASMELESARLHGEAARAQAAHSSLLAAHRLLEDVESRLAGYLDAEHEFVVRWQVEQDQIGEKIGELDALYEVYRDYATAYGSLVLEVERRRTVEERIEAIWRKARESVDKVTEAEHRQREAFVQEVGDFLPTDLWHGMPGGVTRWKVVPVAAADDETGPDGRERGGRCCIGGSDSR